MVLGQCSGRQRFGHRVAIEVVARGVVNLDDAVLDGLTDIFSINIKCLGFGWPFSYGCGRSEYRSVRATTKTRVPHPFYTLNA